jgi:hypothetical protein
MPKNRHVLQVTASTVLTTIHNTILCNHSSPITLTLPLPTANGINYKINRNDNVLVNTVTLNAGANLIIDGTTSSSTFIISPQTYTEIVSLDNLWYISYNILTNPLDTYGLFSSTFVSNNSTPHLVLNGSEVVRCAAIPFTTNFNRPTFFSATINWLAGIPIGRFNIRLDPDTINVSNISITVNPTPSTITINSVISPIPTAGATSMILSWLGESGSKDKFGLAFVRII